VYLLFKPKISRIEELRLLLIEIETSDQLTELSHQFLLRKSVLAFIKKSGIPDAHQNLFGLEGAICSNGLVTQFRHFVLTSLEENRLSQFKMVILKPL
jgi:hypothetical protein